MPRKKSVKTPEPAASIAVAEVKDPSPAAREAVAEHHGSCFGVADAGKSPAPTLGAADDPAAAEGQEQRWAHPYRAVFTCPAKGFELGENRRFKQVVFSFAENPGPEVTRKLKDAGFVYFGADRCWTQPATPASREMAVTLARELKGEELGPRR